jgi:hypothetical protein
MGEVHPKLPPGSEKQRMMRHFASEEVWFRGYCSIQRLSIDKTQGRRARITLAEQVEH